MSLQVTALTFALAAVWVLPLAWACSTPPGGCTLENCVGLWGITPPYQSRGGPRADRRIGWVYGVYNKNVNGGNAVGSTSTRGAPMVNWEVFPAIEHEYIVKDAGGNIVDTRGINNIASCCVMCARTDGCRVFQFFDSTEWWKIKTMWDVGTPVPTWYSPYNFWGDRQCYLLTGGTDNLEVPHGAPRSGTNSQQQATSGIPNRYIAPSWVGGSCNGNTSVVDDPHFTGARGTRFEFNGEVGKTFALISDKRFHMNVRLDGYLDDRTFGATKTVDGKAVRTWIRDIGILWKDNEGVEHTAVLTARTGQKMDRGPSGFMSGITIDGISRTVPTNVEEGLRDGLLSLTLLKKGRKGPFDMDTYELRIDGLLSAKLKMRAAHFLLQKHEEAFVHFNVHIDDLVPTPGVHGVLGQTFRNTVAQTVRALEFRLLNALMRHPIVADGESGKGFLDGEPSDYKTSGILATDAKFSSYV